jgi:hypothetical protein
MGLDDASIRKDGQYSIHTENVKGCFQKPSLALPLVLKHLDLATVMAISGQSVPAVQPFPVGREVDKKWKILGLEGHLLQMKAFGRIIGREGVFAPQLWRQPIQQLV